MMWAGPEPRTPFANTLEVETMYGYGGRVLTIDVGSGRQTVEASMRTSRGRIWGAMGSQSSSVTTAFPPVSIPSIPEIWWSSVPGR